MSSENDVAAVEIEGGRIAELRESIRRLFPATSYSGAITNYDESPDTTELDDEPALYAALKGKAWTDVPKEILETQPDGYVLLTDEAFIAFFPAWLMRSLDDLNAENRVREFVMYAFCKTVGQLRLLNRDQRLTVRSLLAEFGQRDPSSHLRKLASEAIALIETVEHNQRLENSL